MYIYIRMSLADDAAAAAAVDKRAYRKQQQQEQCPVIVEAFAGQ